MSQSASRIGVALAVGVAMLAILNSIRMLNVKRIR